MPERRASHPLGDDAQVRQLAARADELHDVGVAHQREQVHLRAVRGGLLRRGEHLQDKICLN